MMEEQELWQDAGAADMDMDWDAAQGTGELDEQALLPDYLRPITMAQRPYGTLDYLPRTRVWTIKGEPAVIQMARRLFPGCEGRGKNSVRFSASRRCVADLNWLMMRYPLRIQNEAKWQQAIADARRMAISKELQRLQPLKAVPDPATFCGTLTEYQKEGVGYLLRMGRALLADEMGLGKTVQALAWMSLVGRWPALIVVPSHLCRNWQREVERFLVTPDGQPPKVHILRGLTPYELPEVQVYIVHYLLLRGWRKALAAMHFPVVVFDEIQELRHAGTEKYSAASVLSESAEYVAGLSGTPIYNRGGEIWNVLNILEYHALGDWESFSRQWCDGYGNNTVLDPDALGAYLREEGMILRRTKEQVLRELPPKRRLVQEIDSDANVYSALLAQAASKAKRLEEAADGSERALLIEQIAQEERQATGVAKAPHVAAFVAALLDAGERVLLFAHHHRVMDIYARDLKGYSPMFITGRENERQKDAAVQAFMGGQTRLCVISLRAASGLNLQMASCVVFGELDWSPAVHTQAEDRAHRMGQQDSILCYYLVSSRGSDRAMQEVLGLKVSQFIQLMGDRVPTREETDAAERAARAHVMELIHTLQMQQQEKEDA
nr:DEAD/DEAH box helicase [bacterium]